MERLGYTHSIAMLPSQNAVYPLRIAEQGLKAT